MCGSRITDNTMIHHGLLHNYIGYDLVRKIETSSDRRHLNSWNFNNQWRAEWGQESLCLALDPLNAEPGARIKKQGVYLEGEPRDQRGNEQEEWPREWCYWGCVGEVGICFYQDLLESVGYLLDLFPQTVANRRGDLPSVAPGIFTSCVLSNTYVYKLG